MRAIIPPLTVILVVMAWSSVAAMAEALKTPEADIVLSVSGDIAQTNAEGLAVFDMDMLRAMPVETITTTTIWTEGEQVFEGVPLKAVMDMLGATGSVILASAINDYTVEIPADSLTETVPIVAFAQNGEEMSRRQKGPLWIVYPYDRAPEFRTEVIYSRSIWQLDRLEFAQ
ncbi:molybdopterin-dependent oxidoreductase [Primorskyibacter sp. S187A]|uniref:molybdopterin-dependent oxidoreductase n=1 Tax=Primorskyibacter sp. S187A TaxID=3415130 RepID=UPI003C7CB441